ncbi:hypothetical protein C8046_07505 [Serinibacter arcticus]|uniref:Uncharacterized protein n=1 Tax=Serinibacter arcticus TaxID=1655435 RepID=A0A2U1ZU53_9MICO|nr:hypothetical protein [Serinibacter arcticus]PWD50518.1 hypothetical protein C8046_07505 [Serinibacter arcticus]
MPQLWDRIAGRREPAADPMLTLETQAHLSRLTRELWRLDGVRGDFAHAHHVRAAQGAYEGVLRRALRLAGGDDRAHPLGDVVGLELELSSRGWAW